MRLQRSVFLGLLHFALLVGGLASAQVSDGDLTVEPVTAIPCVDADTFQQGQQVRLRGSGFASGASVSVEFSSDPFSAVLGPATADGTGAINIVVTIPGGFTAPTSALVEANGPAPSGSRALDTVIRIGPSGASADGDGDGIPDYCDNCPSNANASQADGDLDGVRDACDACPADSGNDVDGDGICSNVDSCPFDPDNDVDGDGRCGDEDNCPAIANPSQTDADGNGIGDACQTNPSCSDGVDNDGDGSIDHPADEGCESSSDTAETNSSYPCDDGLDNDRDAKTDFRVGGAGDPGCSSSASPTENPECDDESDNDSDGKRDWDGDHTLFPADPECAGLAYHNSEAIPEPGVQIGLGAGMALLAILRKARR